jgi:hypothetical protein
MFHVTRIDSRKTHKNIILKITIFLKISSKFRFLWIFSIKALILQINVRKMLGDWFMALPKFSNK